MIELDARGYNCPMPVVITMKAMDKNPGAVVTVLVDRGSAGDDIARLAKKRKYAVKVEEVSGDFLITLTPP